MRRRDFIKGVAGSVVVWSLACTQFCLRGRQAETLIQIKDLPGVHYLNRHAIDTCGATMHGA